MGESASHKTCFPIYSKIDYINSKTRDGHDAFSLARTYDHEEILEELFRHIPSDDFRWKEKHMIIYKAILIEDLYFLHLYPIWFVINENSCETILHVACTLGCSTTVLHLLQRQDLDHHGPNAIFLREKYHDFTPILSAVYTGQSKCFEYLLNVIIKLTYRDTFIRDLLIDRYDRTLLHICVLSRQVNILEILMLNLQSNPFLFVQFIEPMIFKLDYNDETPLHLAVRLNLYDMCQLLLKFAEKLDQIQQSYIYFDKIDGELIRSQLISSEINLLLTKSRVFIIGYKNKVGQSSFHTSILYGYIHIMNLFLEHVDKFGMNYLLEDIDSNIRTPLHLASLNGYIEIVKQLFLLNINVYTRDNQESTPLHCVAQCVGKKCDDGIDASVYILEIFLNYIQNSKKNSFDLLTALDGFGHNCLETAIISRNRLFVEYLLNLNNIPLFKNLLTNAQILDIHYRHVDTPLRKLVRYMPDLAHRVLDTCITYIGDKHKIIYDFQFLEDHCSIQQWQHHMTSQITKTKSIHKFCCPIFCRHKPLEFRSEYHYQPLPAYTRNPYILVHNNVLSVMCECATKIDLKDQEEEKVEENDKIQSIQYTYELMHHPLCEKLMELKWKQFGLPLFLISFFIYCFYL